MIVINEVDFRKAYKNRSLKNPGVTIAALCGEDKPARFKKLLRFFFKRLRALKDWFEPYDEEQIHATITGLEGQNLSDNRIIHNNLLTRFHNVVNKTYLPNIEFGEILEYFKLHSWPITVQYGGFDESYKNPYDPALTPFDRSFDFQSNGLVVTIGWPIASNGKIISTLLGIRKYLEKFNAIHKYHVRPDQQDNDLFVVLGILNYKKWKDAADDEREDLKETLSRIRTKVRNDIANQAFKFEIEINHVRVVEYCLTTLAKVGYQKRIKEVKIEELHRLYRSSK